MLTSKVIDILLLGVWICVFIAWILLLRVARSPKLSPARRVAGIAFLILGTVLNYLGRVEIAMICAFVALTSQSRIIEAWRSRYRRNR